MLTKYIDFKNFKISKNIKNIKNIKKDLEKLLKEKRIFINHLVLVIKILIIRNDFKINEIYPYVNVVGLVNFRYRVYLNCFRKKS